MEHGCCLRVRFYLLSQEISEIIGFLEPLQRLQEETWQEADVGQEAAGGIRVAPDWLGWKWGVTGGDGCPEVCLGV